MIQDMLGSVASADAYRRFAAEKGSRTVFYTLFLSFIFTLAGAAALKLRVAPAVDETFAWLERSAPTLRFEAGKVTSDVPGPTRLSHPRLPELSMIIDTARTTPVALSELNQEKALAYLTSNTLYLERQPGTMETFDLTKGIDKPTVVDANFYREAARAFKLVVYPAALLAVFGFFAFLTVLVGLVNAVLGVIFNSLMGGRLRFGSLFKIGVHAQTASTIARVVLMFMPFSIPLVGILQAILTAAYTWVGVRANIAEQQAPAA